MNKMREKPTINHTVDVRLEWYKEYSERLEGLVRDFVREYGARDCYGDAPSDLLLPASHQRDKSIEAAMIILDIKGE